MIRTQGIYEALEDRISSSKTWEWNGEEEYEVICPHSAAIAVIRLLENEGLLRLTEDRQVILQPATWLERDILRHEYQKSKS